MDTEEDSVGGAGDNDVNEKCRYRTTLSITTPTDPPLTLNVILRADSWVPPLTETQLKVWEICCTLDLYAIARRHAVLVSAPRPPTRYMTFGGGHTFPIEEILAQEGEGGFD
jgi:hypothetical protein